MSERSFKERFMRAAAVPAVLAGTVLVACSDKDQSAADIIKDKKAEKAQIAKQQIELNNEIAEQKKIVIADCLLVAEAAVQAAVVLETENVDSATAFVAVFDSLNGDSGEAAGQQAMDDCEKAKLGSPLGTNVDTSADIDNATIRASVVLGE